MVVEAAARRFGACQDVRIARLRNSGDRFEFSRVCPVFDFNRRDFFVGDRRRNGGWSRRSADGLHERDAHVWLVRMSVCVIGVSDTGSIVGATRPSRRRRNHPGRFRQAEERNLSRILNSSLSVRALFSMLFY
jgi:hypothetical protein